MSKFVGNSFSISVSFFCLMIDPQSALIGALAIYAVIVHILLSYLYASLKYSKDTLNAQEKDLTQ
ncbi:hypothetical protein 7841G3A2_35 [Haloquadratum phage sp.]|nr:hypothetical protein 7841G3A2_35 [Haloquadratum phage sp.]